MSKITSETVNWSWFDNATMINATVNVINACKEMTNIISVLEITADEKTRTIEDIENIIYTLTGLDPTPPHSMITQQEWYNIWLSQGKPDLFSFSLNFLVEKIKTNQTSQTGTIINLLDRITNFILERHFSTPIPSGYPNSGNKPRLVDNKSEYYTDMTTALHSFFINGGSGINGVGNNTIQEMCANFSRTTISQYKPIKNWCGCFAPESVLTQKAKALYPDSGSYTTACDPLCIYPQAIKVVNQLGSSDPGSNSRCNATLCIMSAIDISNADLNGSINLNQNCPCATSGQPCFCVIDSSVENLLNKTRSPNGGSMADPVTFKQYCPGSQCFVEDKNGNLNQIACQTDNPDQTGGISNATSNKGTVVAPNIWYLFISILLVGITLIQCARFIGYEPKYKVSGILEPKIKISKYTRSTDLGFIKK